MPWFNSCKILMLSNTVLRYSSKFVSCAFNPSNLQSSYNNCGLIKISCIPTISRITVSNCLDQSSSCSRIGINFHNWLVKRRTCKLISFTSKSKEYLVKSTCLHQTGPVAFITAVRNLSTFIQSLHME